MQQPPPRKPGETETEYGRRCEHIERTRARRQEQRQQQQQHSSSARGGDGAREQEARHQQHRPSTMNADYNGVFRGGDGGESAGSFHSGGGGRGRGDESGSSFGGGGDESSFFLGGDAHTYHQQHSSSARGGGGISRISSTPHRSIQAVQPSTVDQQQIFNFFQQTAQSVTNMFGLGSPQPAQYNPHNSHPTDAPHNDWGSGPPHHDPRSAWGPPQHQYAPPHHNTRPADAPHNGWGPDGRTTIRAALGDRRSTNTLLLITTPVQRMRRTTGGDRAPHLSGWRRPSVGGTAPEGDAQSPLFPWSPQQQSSGCAAHAPPVAPSAPPTLTTDSFVDRNAARFNPDENRPPHSSAVARRPSPGRDVSPPFSVTGQTLHRRHENLDSTLSSEADSKPVAKKKNDNDDSDEEVAHAGSGLTAAPSSTFSVSSVAAAQRHSANPSTPEDETSDGGRRKSNSDIDSAVLSEQQNTSQQNQPTETRRYLTRSANRSTTRAPASVPPSEPAQLRARDLAETNLSRFMEAYLGEKEHMPNNNLVIREVARKEKMFERHSLLCDDDAEEGSEEGHYVERTILVFDELDDADLIKFGLCFQEHWSKSLEENQYTVYIDCIDSVKLRAKGVTLTNHSHTFRELLLGYLADAKSRGFKEYHLWACPPAPREEDGIEEQSGTPDYLFCPKPPEQQQQTPDEQRLVGHYWTISRQAHARGILLADSGEPETYAGQYFDDGELLDKIPLFPGSIVESMLNVCQNNDVDKQMVQQSLGTYLEDGVTGFEEESGCALRNSLIIGTLNADDPDPDAIRAGLEEPAQLFSDLFDDWGRFRANEYASNPGWGFSDYDKVKRTSQGIIAKLHRDVEKKKRRRAKKRA